MSWASEAKINGRMKVISARERVILGSKVATRPPWIMFMNKVSRASSRWWAKATLLQPSFFAASLIAAFFILEQMEQGTWCPGLVCCKRIG